MLRRHVRKTSGSPQWESPPRLNNQHNHRSPVDEETIEAINDKFSKTHFETSNTSLSLLYHREGSRP